MMYKPILYYDYESIPPLIVDMVLTVADEIDIKVVPLEEINGFLQGLSDFERSKSDFEYDEGGWAE